MFSLSLSLHWLAFEIITCMFYHGCGPHPPAAALSFPLLKPCAFPMHKRLSSLPS